MGVEDRALVIVKECIGRSVSHQVWPEAKIQLRGAEDQISHPQLERAWTDGAVGELKQPITHVRV